MRRYFNAAGACDPVEHYMVNINERLEAIKKMVDGGAYFTINRARQYGKTTTLTALKKYLCDAYFVVGMDFQSDMSSAKFRDENAFSVAFAKAFVENIKAFGKEIPGDMQNSIADLNDAMAGNKDDMDLVELFRYLNRICQAAVKPVVLMIDEVDSATNNQVFVDFLAQLRGNYLRRKEKTTFQSVILAGVYDIKNIKRRIRADEESKENSPWNIAADFDVEMSFSKEDIAGMLVEYEGDNHTGMDVDMISDLLYDYTSGYPFLVSRICKLMDEKLVHNKTVFPESADVWTREGFLEAVKLLESEKNSLFESLAGKLRDYPELREMIYVLLFQGKEISYSSMNQYVDIAMMFGFVKVMDNRVVIANRIFETVLYTLFLTEEQQGKNVNAFECGEKKMVGREIIEELVSGLCSIFGAGIRQIILYGSVARNNAAPESDVDIAVILDGDMSVDDRDSFISFAAELDLKYDRVFSIIDIKQSNMEKWGDILPFYKNIQEEGIILWKAA